MVPSILNRPGRKIWDITPLLERGLPPVVRPELRPLRHWCGCSVLWFKELRVFERPIIRGEYRIDLYVKCNDCGDAEVFGIHITEEEYNRIIHVLPRRMLTWWEVYRMLGRHINLNDPPY